MVDAIGANGVKVERVTPVATTTPAAPAAAAPRQAPAVAAGNDVGALTKLLSSEAPVDVDRVAKIKRAIATGSFPILPATIADRLLALKLEWTGDDQA